MQRNSFAILFYYLIIFVTGCTRISANILQPDVNYVLGIAQLCVRCVFCVRWEES